MTKRTQPRRRLPGLALARQLLGRAALPGDRRRHRRRQGDRPLDLPVVDAALPRHRRRPGRPRQALRPVHGQPHPLGPPHRPEARLAARPDGRRDLPAGGGRGERAGDDAAERAGGREGRAASAVRGLLPTTTPRPGAGMPRCWPSSTAADCGAGSCACSTSGTSTARPARSPCGAGRGGGNGSSTSTPAPVDTCGPGSRSATVRPARCSVRSAAPEPFG